jgi:molecular chaperone IbpA
MRTFDFTPLYRSTVGFDRLFDLMDRTAQGEAPANWPPYNIERQSENEYRITMALAGFAPDQIELVQQENVLLVAGHKNAEQENGQVLHRGIATRPFRQTFNLAERVKVESATFENGLLTVNLKREVPEALKPRRIEISGPNNTSVPQNKVTTIEQSKAA